MLISRSYLETSSPAAVWRRLFRTAWWFTGVLVVAALVVAPIDFFAGGNPGWTEIGPGDRVANAISVLLLHNVLLMMMLFAAHVTRLLEAGQANAATRAAGRSVGGTHGA